MNLRNLNREFFTSVGFALTPFSSFSTFWPIYWIINYSIPISNPKKGVTNIAYHLIFFMNNSNKVFLFQFFLKVSYFYRILFSPIIQKKKFHDWYSLHCSHLFKEKNKKKSPHKMHDLWYGTHHFMKFMR